MIVIVMIVIIVLIVVVVVVVIIIISSNWDDQFGLIIVGWWHFHVVRKRIFLFGRKREGRDAIFGASVFVDRIVVVVIIIIITVLIFVILVIVAELEHLMQVAALVGTRCGFHGFAILVRILVIVFVVLVTILVLGIIQLRDEGGRGGSRSSVGGGGRRCGRVEGDEERLDFSGADGVLISLCRSREGG